jgi:hypothetical protein
MVRSFFKKIITAVYMIKVNKHRHYNKAIVWENNKKVPEIVCIYMLKRYVSLLLRNKLPSLCTL